VKWPDLSLSRSLTQISNLRVLSYIPICLRFKHTCLPHLVLVAEFFARPDQIIKKEEFQNAHVSFEVTVGHTYSFRNTAQHFVTTRIGPRCHHRHYCWFRIA
jgi:hypothetical protein